MRKNKKPQPDLLGFISGGTASEKDRERYGYGSADEVKREPTGP